MFSFDKKERYTHQPFMDQSWGGFDLLSDYFQKQLVASGAAGRSHDLSQHDTCSVKTFLFVFLSTKPTSICYIHLSQLKDSFGSLSHPTPVRPVMDSGVVESNTQFYCLSGE